MVTLWFVLRAMLQGRLAALAWVGRKYPETARLSFGGRRGRLLNKPELVEEMLVERPGDFQKGPLLRIHSRLLLGDGLLTSEGDEHRKRRRLVAPAFAHQRVFRYAEVMAEMARSTRAGWQDGAIVPMQREMTRLTLAIVGRTLFDVDLLGDADQLGNDITEVIRFATSQVRSFRPLSLEAKHPRVLRALESAERLDRTIFQLIERRRQSGEDKGDLLSMLLLSTDEDGNALTDQQVRDEAMTLFLAGHETTANAMTWALYLLARHDSIQRELHAQIRHAAGDEPVKFEHLARIPLALQVFKEALRLYPPAYIIVREVLENGTMDGGIPIAQGELLAVCEWIIHRDPRYFPSPERFDPARFTPENEAKIHKYAYFPFGAGKRICIGNQFALMEGQILLATLLQHHSVATVDPRPWETDPLITLRPKGPGRLRVTRH